MLINLFLASLFVLVSLTLLINFERAYTVAAKLTMTTIKFIGRSKLLAETLFRAYFRYQKIANQKFV